MRGTEVRTDEDDPRDRERCSWIEWLATEAGRGTQDPESQGDRQAWSWNTYTSLLLSCLIKTKREREREREIWFEVTCSKDGASQVVLVVKKKKKPTCHCKRHKRHRLSSWIEKIPWRRAWQPTPVFLPGESPWTEEPGGLESIGSQTVDTTEAT